MAEREDILVKYISDQLAAETHTLEAVEKQLDDDDVKKYPRVVNVLEASRDVLRDHTEVLKAHLEEDYGVEQGKVTSAVKEALSSVTGNLSALYSMVRSEKVSKMLRDDYAALSLCSLTYTMLHATARTLNEDSTAGISLHHLKDVTPLVVEINEVIPAVVISELAERGLPIDESAKDETLIESHEAWSRSNVQRGIGGQRHV